MKNIVINILKSLFAHREQIKIVYLFGSIINEKKYADIDIGIFIDPLPDNIYEVTADLKHQISRELMRRGVNFKADDIDIVILNLVNFKFLNRILREGLIILDRDPDFRANLLEKNSIRFRECVGIIKESEILIDEIKKYSVKSTCV